MSAKILSTSLAMETTVEGEPLDQDLVDLAGVDLATLFAEYKAFRDGAITNGQPLGSFEPTNTFLPAARGYVVIDAVASDASGRGLLQKLEALGMQNGSFYMNAVSGLFPIGRLPDLLDVANLGFASASYAASRVGSVENQADASMQTDDVRVDFGLDGTGITIGILSDSFDTSPTATTDYNDDILSGDLPSGINILEDFTDPDTIDEGRAMAQLIHDIVPGSDLAFATAFTGQANFANNINALAAFSDVVVDDIFYFAEPFFQDGIIAQAVDAAFASGVQYYSSAGNSDNAAYRADFSGVTGTVLGNTATWHDFDPGAGVDLEQDFTLASGQSIRISLQWDEPYITGAPGSGGSASDVDIFLINTDTNTVLASGVDSNIGADPFEFLPFVNTTGGTLNVALAINLFSGPAPNVIKYVDFTGNSQIVGIEHATNSGTSVGHASAEGGQGVGAAFYQDTPAFGTTPPELEGFSSLGDAPILFDAAGNRLGTPEIRERVDITAPDGTNNSFFGSDVEGDGFPNFFGTSAAAPHAAALGALLLEADGTLTPTQVYDALEAGAIDIVDRADGLGPTALGYDNWSGHGLVNAPGAFAAAGITGTALVVDTLIDEDDGNTNAGDLSLREAIAIAETTDQNITFDAALAGGIIRLDATLNALVISDGTFTIDGNIDNDVEGLADIIITGDTGANDLTVTNAMGDIVTDAVNNTNDSDNVRVFTVTNATTDVTFESLVVTGGGTGIGGGIAVAGGASLTINNSTIQGNKAGTDGGGIDILNSNATITNSTIAGNVAGDDGGGIYTQTNLSGFVTSISNSTISGNSATDQGGGVYNTLGFTEIANATVTNNFAANGGAGVSSDDNANTQTNIVSTIVAGNTGSPDVGLQGVSTNSFNSLGNNLIGADDDNLFTNGVNNDQVGTTAAAIDADLAGLGDNGGATATHLPNAASPVIDSGANPDELLLDQRGLARTEGLATDIGSVETSGLPDLVIQNFGTSATVFSAGETVLFNWDAANIGSGASGIFDTGVYISTDSNVTTSDTFIDFLDTDNVTAPGDIESQIISTVIPTLTAGTYWIAAIADDLFGVAETDETNNVSTAIQVTIEEPLDPVTLFDDSTPPNIVGGFTTIAAAVAAASSGFLIVANNSYTAGPETVSTDLNELSIDTPAGTTTTFNLTGAAPNIQFITSEGDGNLVVNGNAAGGVLNGLGGDDVYSGTEGLNILNGNGGNDTLNILLNRAELGAFESPFNGSVSLSNAQGDVFQFTGTETINFNDITFSGGIVGGPGNNFVGTAANDIILASISDDTVTGDIGNDVIFAYEGEDTVEGGGGNDTIEGGAGTDILRGDGGNDNLRGGDDADVLSGGAGNDVVNGENGEDVLFGGAGNDLLFGGAGFDRIFGGDGTDRIFGGDANDIANGGGDNDIINTGSGNDLVFAQNGNDLVFTQAGNDNVFGGGGNDKVFGGDGNDEINGGAGNDEIFGGAGMDEITGAAGNDILSGGGDSDTFFFFADQGADTLTDYTGADRLDISSFGVTDGTGSDQDWRDATASVVTSGGGNNVTIAWDGGGTLVIENIGIASLTDADFIF